MSAEATTSQPSRWNLSKEAKDILRTVHEDDPFLLLIPEVLDLFHKMGSAYAITGGLAAAFHGGKNHTGSPLFLMSEESWRCLRDCRDTGFVCEQHSPKKAFLIRQGPPLDKESGSIRMQLSLLGSQVLLCERIEPIREVLYGLFVVKRSYLIGSDLAKPGPRRRSQVVSLIRSRNLDESFLTELPPEVHAAFTACLERRHREDRREARRQACKTE